MMKIVLSALLLIAICLPKMVFADSNNMTGNDLLPACKMEIQDNDNNILDLGANSLQDETCLSYVQGNIDFLASLVTLYVIPLPFCPPNHLSTQQIIRVVTKFMDDNPDKLNVVASIIITKALINSYPCNK